MKPEEIKIGKHYIITKIHNEIKKEQYALIDNIYNIDGKTTYEFSYGFFRSHEGFCSFENIRELTEDEKTNRINLPRQFYDVP